MAKIPEMNSENKSLVRYKEIVSTYLVGYT